MLLTEAQVRDNLRNRDGKRVFFLGPRDQLTSGARDFLQRERVEIRPAGEARIRQFRLADGETLDRKPEHMTHLRDNLLVPKNHPGIRFRGALDSLQCDLLLGELQCPGAAEGLREIRELSSRILRCDVMEEPLPEGKLRGLTEEEIHRRSHFPGEYYGIPHFMPRAEDGLEIAILNRLRARIRETELAGAEAFLDSEGNCSRPDLMKALNRMSSMAYILMIEKKAGKL